MNKLTVLIREDMKPALGVTEPGAIAFAVARAREYTAGEIKSVQVALNSGMYKNAFTCGIPNSDRVGNVFAAALGAVAGDASLGLEALANVTEEDNRLAEKLTEQGKVKAVLDHMGSEITIDACVHAGNDCCEVQIAGGHTDIIRIVKNGQILFENSRKECSEDGEPDIHKFSLKELYAYADAVSYEEIGFIKDAFDMNMELLNEGLSSDKTSFGPMLLKENGGNLISSDALKTAQLLCNGAIEARVMGLERPAMSITGSGAHGIIATLPLYAWYKTHQDAVSEEMLLKAAAFSYLITMYIKEYSGKLSAFCGCGIAAGTGMACGLAYMRGADVPVLDKVIRNMASGLTGMICDGGNQGCVMKGIVAVDAAFRAVSMALKGICIDSCHGINGKCAEDTMKNMGLIASPGMTETEKTIVEIMQNK